jgi:hypothetical protein
MDVAYRRIPQVAEVSLSPGRVVVLRLDDPAARPRALEGTGCVIWNAIDGARGLAEIVSHIADTFEIASGAIGPDVSDFLQLLVSLRLIDGIRIETPTPQPLESRRR